MYVGQGLCQVAAQTVLTVLIGVLGEERDVFQGHGVLARKEDAQLGLGLGAVRLQHHLVLLPLGALHVDFLLHKLLVFLHRVLLDELHANLRVTLWCLGPHGEAVFLALLHAYAEKTLVLQACATLAVAGVVEYHIVRAALEGAVVLQVYATEGTPSHQGLVELE